MKVVILGSSGMLGSDLVKAYFDHEVIAFSREELDITQKEDLEKIRECKPDVVLNAAAYTAVDIAEIHEEVAFLVNADAVLSLAKLCEELSCTFIHFSTDYVFDGKKEFYYEESVPKPLSVYGRSKAKGEEHTLSHGGYVIRTSWLYGDGENFVKTILDLASKKNELTIVDDQIGSPTYTKDLAKATLGILEKESGVYHVTNAGFCSWYDFANEIARLKHLKAKILPIPSSELKRPAKRPKRSVLKNTKIEPLRSWQEALAEYLK